MSLMSVTTRISRGDLAVVAESRGYSLAMDQSKKNGGLENSLKPMEILLAALGGCLTMVARGQAALKGVDVEDLRLEMEGESSSDGFESISVKAYVKSSSSPSRIKEFLEYVESVCPVSNSLKAKIGLEVVVE